MLSIIHQKLSKVKNFFIFFCISRFRHLRSFKPLSAANSFSLAHLHLFVKNFFLRFRSFFAPDSHPLCFPLENAPLYYHPHPHLSTLFCPIFSPFFLPTTTCANITFTPQNSAAPALQIAPAAGRSRRKARMQPRRPPRHANFASRCPAPLIRASPHTLPAAPPCRTCRSAAQRKAPAQTVP